MSDERFQELSRRASAGDLSAAGILLRERMRAGDLDPSLLELAACFGDESARIALGGCPPDVDARVWWFLGPDYLGRGGAPRWAEVVERVGLACKARVLRALLHAHGELLTAAQRELVPEVEAAIERWERGAEPGSAEELYERVPSPLLSDLLRLCHPDAGHERLHFRLSNLRCDFEVAYERLRREVVPWALGLSQEGPAMG